MAIPSASINIISVNENDKTITYEVSYSAESHFTANQPNYYDYLAKIGNDGEPYVGYTYANGNKTGDTISYSSEYKKFNTSKTISVTYQYYKIYLTESYTGWVNYGSGSYDTYQSAEAEMHKLQYGKLGLYQVIQDDGKYIIQQKTGVSYGTSTNSFPTSKTITATASFSKKPTPSIGDISTSTTSASVTVGNLENYDEVTFSVSGIGSFSKTSGGSSVTPQATGLSSNTTYNYTISVNGEQFKSSSFTTDTPLPTPTGKLTTSSTDRSITATVNNARSGDSFTFYYRKNTDGAANTKSETWKADTTGSSHTFTKVSGLSYNTIYVASIFQSGVTDPLDTLKNIFFPSPTYSTTSASISVNEVESGDKVEFIVGTKSASTNATESSVSLTVTGLSPGTRYSYTVKWKNVEIGSGYFYTATYQPSYSIVKSYTRVTVNIKDIEIGDNIKVIVRNAFGDEYEEEVTAEKSTESIVINGLYDNFYHTIEVYINDILCEDGPVEFETAKIKESAIFESGVKNVIFEVSNIDKGIIITLSLTGGNLVINETYESNSDDSSNRWNINVEWDTIYSFTINAIYPNGEVIPLNSNTFIIVAPSYSISNITKNSVTINVFDIKAKYDVTVSVGSNIKTKQLTSNGDTSFIFDDLNIGTEYPVEVSIGGFSVSGKDLFYTLFDWWISKVEQGVQMSIWIDEDQKTYPAPIKAVEWNRLIDLVNKKKSKSITSVSAGQEMIASSGGNIRQVADVLGVSVASKSRITAQFFLDLKTAINNILN